MTSAAAPPSTPASAPEGRGPGALRALVVDDSPETHALLDPLLRQEGFRPTTALTGSDGLRHIARLDPDLVVLDLGLPDMSGMDVCRELRRMTDAYVVMLTARDTEVDRVTGFALGADDYLTKPFSRAELVARVRALLRRPRERVDVDTDAEYASLRLDRERRAVEVEGQTLSLTRTEFELLGALVGARGRVLTREVLIERVWGAFWSGCDHAVDVHMSNLRKRLATVGLRDAVSTIRGVGYAYDPDAVVRRES